VGEGLAKDASSLHRQLLNAVGQAAIAMDLTGTVVYWNAAAEQMYGWTAAEAVGQPLASLLLADDDATAGAGIVASVLTGRTWAGETWVRRKDGTRFPVLVTDSPVVDGNGTVVGIIGVSVDLSERHAAQRALGRSEEQFRRRFTDGSLPQAVADLDGVLTAVNPALCGWIGYPEWQLVGRPAGDFIVAQDRPQLLADSQALRDDSGRRSVDSVRRYRRSDGAVLSGLVSVMLIRDDRDEPVHFAIFIQDITDRLAAEEALRVSESQLLARFQHSSVPQLCVDMARQVTAVNDAFCTLLGGPPEVFVGRSAPGALAPQCAELADPGALRLFAGEQESCRFEMTLYRLDGVAVPVLLHLTMLRDLGGAPSGAECHVMDLTSQRAAEDGLRRRDVLNRALAANAADVALVVGLDGRVGYLSPSAAQILTVRAGDLVDLSTVHPDDRAAVRDKMAEVRVKLGASVTMTYRSLDRSGDWRWVEQVATNRLADPDIGGLVVNLRDVHERVRAERSLVASEARYRLIAETAQEGIWTTDGDGRTLFANRRMAELLGRPLSDLYRYRSYELAGQATGAAIQERMRHRHRTGAEQYEIVHDRPDGRRVVLRASASPLIGDDGKPIGSLAMVSDITEGRRAEDKLRRQALHDLLTGLPNRGLLLDRLQDELDRRQRNGSPVAVLLVDLDQFKLVNDSLGHAAGDALLIVLGQRLCAQVRAGDTVGRLGGDEFLVLCPGLDEAQAHALATRLLTDMSAPVEVAGRTITVSASIGLVVTPVVDVVTPAAAAETLVAQADAAMYEAKARGRARTAVFDAVLAERAGRELELSNDLRRALAADELSLHYQPVVDLATNRVLGVEALSRWNHPQQGFIAPTEFISVAEQSGLIATLDHWVIRRACRDASAMRKSGALPVDAYVGVNLSARNVGDDTLEAVVRRAAEDAGLPLEVLVLEVTESGMMNDPEKARIQLESLRAMGARIAIDDFGTGYSSLAYLRRFPVSTLKIDRSFVANISNDPDNLAIVAAIIEMARALGLVTVAEGIETPAELASLTELGCQAGQGYLWSPAVPPEGLGAVLDHLPRPAPAGAPWSVRLPLPVPREARGRARERQA